MNDLLIHTEAGVTTITFNRLARKNALNTTMYTALVEALHAAQADDSVRVVLLQGDVTVFCAGNDIADFVDNPPITEDAPVVRFLQTIAAFPKMLVAAVCGPAVGVGASMLLHCDLVYAGDNAVFSMPFVNLGLCPEAAASLLVPQLMGYRRAAEVLLLGEPFMAEAALEVGWVNRVVPPTECHAIAQTQARKLAAKPARPLLETKRLMRAHQTQPVQEAMRREAEVFMQLVQEPAARQAFAAFVDQRLPS